MLQVNTATVYLDQLSFQPLLAPAAAVAGTPGTALTPVIDSGAQEEFSLEDWLAQTDENELHLRTSLNGLLHRHLRYLGMSSRSAHPLRWLGAGQRNQLGFLFTVKNRQHGRSRWLLAAPFHLRNILVQAAVDRLVEARWTDDEWIRNLAANVPAIPVERPKNTCPLMNDALPSATVVGYENHIEAMRLPDPNDRHVLAAGIAAGATVILTWNLRHFPAKELKRFVLDHVGGPIAVGPHAGKRDKSRSGAPRSSRSRFPQHLMSSSASFGTPK